MLSESVTKSLDYVGGGRNVVHVFYCQPELVSDLCYPEFMRFLLKVHLIDRGCMTASSLRLSLPSGLLSSGSPLLAKYELLIFPCVLHVQRIQSVPIFSPF